MPPRSFAMTARSLHRLVIAVMAGLIALAQPGWAHAQATPVAALNDVDLAAIVLTPADLEEIGLAGFERKANGVLRRFDDYVVSRARFLNMEPAELGQLLTEAGWQAGYATNLGLPSEPGNPESQELAIAFTAVHAYADADGARMALAGNYDYSGVTTASVDRGVGPADTVGDASFMTRTLGTPEPEMGPSDEIALTMRVDRLIASVGLIRYGLTEADLASPVPVDDAAIGQVQTLATLVEARMGEALSQETPRLFNRLVRFGDDAPIAFETEGYRLIRGTIPPYYGGFEDDFPPLAETAGLEAAYELNQALAAAGDPFLLIRLFEFGAPQAATDFLAAQQAAPFNGGEPVEGVLDEITPANALGAYAFEIEPGVTVEGYAAWVAVDATVALVLIEGQTRPADVVITELVAAQVDCLERAEPCSSVVPPEGLAG
jgi:hypothetical protein